MNNSISLHLHTLKSENTDVQTRTIAILSQTHLHLYNEIITLIQTKISGDLLRLDFFGTPDQLVQLAMLTIVAADILTIPDHDSQISYHDTLHNTLSHFGLSETDVCLMISISSRLEIIFESYQLMV